MLINVSELVPQYISKIYDGILKGHFINENSNKNGYAELYRIISENEIEIRAYFKPLGYTLIKRNGYFYFSRDDAPDHQSNLETIVDYIDIVNFLKTIDSNFTVDYPFVLSSMEHQLNNNIELQDLASKMRGINATSNREFIQKIIDKLKKSGFVEERNSLNGEFIVLKSYDYLETFFKEVDIYE
jgi:hypothetical protein